MGLLHCPKDLFRLTANPLMFWVRKGLAFLHAVTQFEVAVQAAGGLGGCCILEN